MTDFCTGVSFMAGRGLSLSIAKRAVFVAACLAAFPLCSKLYAGPYGTTIIDPTVTYTNSTGGGGLGSFNTSGLDPGFDDDEVLFQFSVSQTSTLTAFTTSFADGGFAPDLTLFADDGSPGDPTGLFIAQGSEGVAGSCGPTQGTDSATGYCLDSLLQTMLSPGNYLLVLTEDPNVSFGDDTAFDNGTGFLYAPSQNDFNGGFYLEDNSAFPRTAAFDVEADLQPVPTSSTPEPRTIPLLFSALIAGAAAYRRKLFNQIPEEHQ
jgi:hypothetical protein